MTWIRIEEIKSIDDDIAIIPKDLDVKDNKINIKFGLRSISANVVKEDSFSKENNSFYKPMILKFSQSIIHKLMIEDIVYQMNLKEGDMNIGPYIGLLLGEQYYFYHNRYMKEFSDMLQSYSEYGGLIVAFKAKNIDFINNYVYGLYYNYNIKEWKYGRFSIPPVVFQRTFQTKKSTIKRLKKITDGNVFNSKRLDKWEVYDYATKKEDLKVYFPETEKVEDFDGVNKFIDKYNNIIMKPVGLSRGRGIIIINKIKNNIMKLYDYRDNKKKCDIVYLDYYGVKEFLTNKKILEKEYIIQPQLELSTINGSLFDIRVVMQKNVNNIWECSGIECRLAGGKDLVTNVARGGRALHISEAIKISFGSKLNHKVVKEKVKEISKCFCEFMDKQGLFAEIGMDIAIDCNGKYWIIEANVRPSFKGFKLMDYKNYLHICEMPVLYAVNMTGFERKAVRYEEKI